MAGIEWGTIGGIRRRRGVGKACRMWLRSTGGPETTGIRNDGRAHVEKNEGEGRGLQTNYE